MGCVQKTVLGKANFHRPAEQKVTQAKCLSVSSETLKLLKESRGNLFNVCLFQF
jgi:hypothetical protein